MHKEEYISHVGNVATVQWRSHYLNCSSTFYDIHLHLAHTLGSLNHKHSVGNWISQVHREEIIQKNLRKIFLK